jgi:hypothetical protein
LSGKYQFSTLLEQPVAEVDVFAVLKKVSSSSPTRSNALRRKRQKAPLITSMGAGLSHGR